MNRARRGSAAIETAAAIPVFILLLTAATDFAFIGLIQHQLGHAARIASRYGVTGQAPTTADGAAPVAWCDGDAQTSNARLTKVRQLIAGATGAILRPEALCLKVMSYGGGYAAVGKPEPFLDLNGNTRFDPGEPFTDVNNDGSWSADQGAAALGVGSEVAVYALRYTAAPVTGMTPGLPAKMRFEARLVVRNEPYR